ncbi:CubicO group peptidase (beta-lactamase class C family) [Bradyrhizobium elkanii]|jgi:CubicO group peptidase (beta-lactamase class C family)|nr:CubicO group peptidase (beta-lactamase class C family) [Bradyrhizobium elkanii]MCS3558114.1 CubicO group peptidase (beta-lactamase class C family) [Bradyrhizobium elkanii]MCW2152039.1 CubicO group peptidase (beta-lactamase class C family) [Bradyrhizobium elkanii]MCW2358085.1 CubicO group peptidase (beta-lactamase class C family) [Bradyrhizobium elkanii]MCW2375770.1 CubicO group peptidase (beta-lactamase class C family) [Bradyrhizobium elkanii]
MIRFRRIGSCACMRGGRAFVASLAFALVATVAKAGSAGPAAHSFSAEGLAKVSDYVRNEVATGKIPGAILLLQQHGKPVYYEKFGVRDAATEFSMSADTIFRLYSMSKPITTVIAMMLIEEGKLALGDPVSKYIPAFADMKVGVEKRGDEGKMAMTLEPLKRPITIEDLMRHTAGLPYGYYGGGIVNKTYADAGLFDNDPDNAEFVARLAALPLAEQPGTQWDYGHSTDVLGRVIEVITGKSLFQVEKERLLGPLGMNETAFHVADRTKWPLIAEPMPKDRTISPVADVRNPRKPLRWESGGGGMVGTIGDYARFSQMLLNGGSYEGRRYLKPETIALMARDHIGPETGVVRDQNYYPGPNSGFGLGFAVRTSVPVNTDWPLGEYRWDGVGGTFFFIDPADDLFGIFMVQTPSQRGRIQQELKTLIYQAMGR